MNKEKELTKIIYYVPEGEEAEGESESLWAYSLGNQLYELQNIPFFAEHLSVEDIVRCKETDDDLPVIEELVKRSGNRTLRVIFKDETPDNICIDIMKELRKHEIFSEKVSHKRFMFNIPPTSDYRWAQKFLSDKDDEGLLWVYEQESYED